MKEFRVRYEISSKHDGTVWHDAWAATLYTDRAHAETAAADRVKQRGWFRNVRVEEREVGPWEAK